MPQAFRLTNPERVCGTSLSQPHGITINSESAKRASTSIPELSVERTIAYRLGYILLCDFLSAAKVGNRPRYFKYSAVRTRTQSQSFKRAFEQIAALVIAAVRRLFEYIPVPR